MSKLLRADFVRMKKSKMYWVGLVTLLGMGIMLLLSCYSSSLKYDVPSSQVLREAIFQNMIMIFSRKMVKKKILSQVKRSKL